MNDEHRCTAYELGPVQMHLRCKLPVGHDGAHDYDRSGMLSHGTEWLHKGYFRGALPSIPDSFDPSLGLPFKVELVSCDPDATGLKLTYRLRHRDAEPNADDHEPARTGDPERRLSLREWLRGAR